MGCCGSGNSKTDYPIVMVGLDGAGKTTILYQLTEGKAVQTIPTVGFNVETMTHKGTPFTIWDAAGQGNLRQLWNHYYKAAKGIIFVVDSNDGVRIDEGSDSAKAEIQNLMDEEQLKGVPLLIFANKQDMDQAIPVESIQSRLNLDSISDRQWNIVGCTATSGDGLTQGIDWMREQVLLKI